MQVNEKHRLMGDDGEAVTFDRSPNQSGRLDPRFLVMHFTAGRSAESSVRWLKNPRAKASAHLVIGRDGSVTQLVPFNKKAWHAGRSRWKGLVGLNRHSIGIELDNAGKLRRVGDGWQTWFGRKVHATDVVEEEHPDGRVDGWHAYSEVQIETAISVGSALMERYGFSDVLGHSDIAPRRKTDPGPAFPMGSYRAILLGRDEDEDEEELLATTTRLNIRSGPGAQNDKIRESPLPKSTRVVPLEQDGSWMLVDVLELPGEEDLQGWVHSRYLKQLA
jgi:N-acetylmuramoyl-L-alanine amidase